MTLPTTRQTPRRRLHRVWQLLPAQAQKPLRSLLSATGLLPRLQRLVTPGASDKHGFITLTPETPGALTSSLAHIAQHAQCAQYAQCARRTWHPPACNQIIPQKKFSKTWFPERT